MNAVPQEILNSHSPDACIPSENLSFGGQKSMRMMRKGGRSTGHMFETSQWFMRRGVKPDSDCGQCQPEEDWKRDKPTRPEQCQCAGCNEGIGRDIFRLGHLRRTEFEPGLKQSRDRRSCL